MDITKYLAELGYDTIDKSYYSLIEVWKSWYRSKVGKFHTYRIYSGSSYIRCKRHAMGMAKKVAEDMADVLLNEHVNITISDEDTDKYVKKVLEDNNWTVLGNIYQEKKAAYGTVAYVPYITDAYITDSGEFEKGNGKIKIDYVTAENIYPLSWENDVVTECAFIFPKTYKNKSYAVIQMHILEDGEYVIHNHVVLTTKGAGTEIEKDKWKELKPFATLLPIIHTGTTKRQFVIDKLNIANNYDDDNPMGIAIFANAIDQLKGCDIAYDSYVNEYVLGKKRIYTSEDVMQEDITGKRFFDPDDVAFYKLPGEEMSKSNAPIIESNMELRADEHNKGINDFLNILSLKCGFGTEHYKFENGNITTATQVISENSDMYRTIKKHENILDSVLRELITIICYLGNTIGANLTEDVEIQIDFDDSIIEDKGAARKEDRNDVSMGVMRLEEYRAKYYGETLEKARQNLPEQEKVLE